MYHLIKVLWQYVVCVINWNNKNSLMLIWTLNYYTYCYIIVSTIFVIKFDSHIFFFFFSRNVQNQKQKNLHMDSLVCQRSSSCSSFNSHYYIFLWTKEGILLHLLVDQVHACIPFLLWSHGEYTFICIFKNSSFPLFFIRWSTRVFSF